MTRSQRAAWVVSASVVVFACGGKALSGGEHGAGVDAGAAEDVGIDATPAGDGPIASADAACSPGLDDPPGPHGTADPTFADGGTATFPPPDVADVYRICLFSLPGDQALLIGGAHTENFSAERGRGYHLAANGATVGVWPFVPDTLATLEACAQGPDRRTFLVTSRYDVDGGWSEELAHFDATGTSDPAFGRPTTPFPAAAMAVSAAGEPIVASSDPDSITLARLGPDGSLLAQKTIRGGTTAVAMTRSPAGNVYIAGVTSLAARSAGAPAAMYIARIVNDGPDLTFGDGWATLPIPDARSEAIAFDEQERLLVVVASSTSLRIARFTAQGQLDPCFGDHGLTDAQQYLYDAWRVAIAVQPNGKAVVAVDSRLWRFDAHGALDVDFGGAAGITLASGVAHVPALTILPSGGILAAYRGPPDGYGLLRVVP